LSGEVFRQVGAAIQTLVSLPFLGIFGWLFRPSDLGSGQVVLLSAYVAGFVLKWSLVWAAFAFLAPDCLLPGESAVGTTAEVLPALIVSIFVFILGSFFVVTQLATTIHSNRSSLILLYDQNVQHAVARPLVIAISTLALAMFRPEEQVDTAVAAFAVTLMLATAFTLLGSAALLPSLISRVTAPRNFALWLVEPVEGFLSIGATEGVVWRVGALGEMLKRGVRNGDSLQIRTALGGLQGLHAAYLEASAANPSARIHHYDDGSPVMGWLGDEIVPALVSSGQDAVALDIANEDGNLIANTLAGFGAKSAEADHREEFMRAVTGLTELATCTQQMRIPGLANHIAEPVYGLAVLVESATRHLDEEAAAHALATWSLSVAYAMRHLGGNVVAARHSQWAHSLRRIGKGAPFGSAAKLAQSQAFQQFWTNKITGIGAELNFARTPPQPTGRKGGLAALLDTLKDAEKEVP